MCAQRLLERRYDPKTGKRVQIGKLQPEKREEAILWPDRPTESNLSLVQKRFSRYSSTKADLRSAYKLNSKKESGLMYTLPADGTADHLLERVEASLVRPIPTVLE